MLEFHCLLPTSFISTPWPNWEQTEETEDSLPWKKKINYKLIKFPKCWKIHSGTGSWKAGGIQSTGSLQILLCDWILHLPLTPSNLRLLHWLWRSTEEDPSMSTGLGSCAMRGEIPQRQGMKSVIRCSEGFKMSYPWLDQKSLPSTQRRPRAAILLSLQLQWL